MRHVKFIQSELFAAQFTRKRFLFLVRYKVVLQFEFRVEAFAASVTGEGFHARVKELMAFQVAYADEFRIALVTFVRFFT